MKSPSFVLIASVFAVGGILATTIGSYGGFHPPTAVAEDTSEPEIVEAPITREEVIHAQNDWGNAIVAIGEAYTNGGYYEAIAEETVDTLYAYDVGPVLFKPTKASEEQFRLTEEDAISYFVTGRVDEDMGFAIQPWSQVRFETADIIIDRDSAIAMGNYYFTDADSNQDVKVEFTFGYQKDDNGQLLINLHHSSLPYASD